MKDSDAKYFVDAGPLVALINKSDRFHGWSKGVINALGETLFTTETVIAEACYVLGNTQTAMRTLTSLMEANGLSIVPVYPWARARINGLVQKYERMDVADAALVALSEKHPDAKLITIDRTDFTIYRRSDGKPVPCIMPPAS